MKDGFLRKLFEYRSWIKWTVYSLLLINFGYYFWEEWAIAAHALRDGGTLIDWASAFAASLEEIAWFVLLVLFELETHALPDEIFTPRVERALHLTRIFVAILLAHTLYAYATYAIDLERKVALLPGVTNLCEVADQDVSFAYNMDYTTIDSENCSELSNAGEFYQVIVESVVTDADGLNIEKQLAWVDVIELSVWLLIILGIEIEVRLQERDIVGGLLMRVVNISKVLLYGTLVLVMVYWAYRSLMVYWAYRSQWVYVWDEFVWIVGFFVIEMNVIEWREEIKEDLA
jgi:hypothetical protein